MILNRSDNRHAAFTRRMPAMISGPPLPDREFILSGPTYGEVYQMAASFWKDFQELDPKRALVCLCAENKAVIAAAVLASVCSGTILILPFSYSANVIEELQRSMEFQAVIPDPGRELPAGVNALYPTTPGRQEWSGIQADRLNPEAELLRLYTGGSTGKPRIWSKTIGNLFSEACFHSEKMAVCNQDRFVATVPPNHIYGLLFSVLVPLVSGAGVAGETPVFPQEIVSAMEQYEASILVSIPMHYRVLNGCAVPRRSLRLALSSAGVLERGDGIYFHGQTGVGVTEIYGSTETGGIASRCVALGETAFTPFEAVDWKIADDECLQVRSDFIPPGLEKDQDGFFSTSDRVTLHGDQGFVLLGRSDGVIKVGGRRVDLEEIRERLKKMAGVKDAVVIAIPVEMGRENEIAALIEGDTDVTRIRRELAAILSPYAFPRTIRVIPRIPRTAAGKYNRLEIEEILKNHAV